ALETQLHIAPSILLRRSPVKYFRCNERLASCKWRYCGLNGKDARPNGRSPWNRQCTRITRGETLAFMKSMPIVILALACAALASAQTEPAAKPDVLVSGSKVFYS